MVSELALFQVAAVAALVGMALGWRGVMTRYAGFYDLPTAWNQIFWGIVIGGLFGSFSDRFLFSPYYTAIIEGKTNNLALSNLVVLVLGLSIGIHLMLRRDRVRKSGSQPTSGWALGLAIGGMTSMYLMFRFMQLSEFSVFAIMNIILLAIALPPYRSTHLLLSWLSNVAWREMESRDSLISMENWINNNRLLCIFSAICLGSTITIPSHSRATFSRLGLGSRSKTSQASITTDLGR